MIIVGKPIKTYLLSSTIYSIKECHSLIDLPTTQGKESDNKRRKRVKNKKDNK